VPKGVKVALPLQAYFRINTQNFGQFERTLIIVDEGAEVHYIEGCTAPVYATDSLHAAVVEIIAKPYARVRYTTVQNWSNNVYNLVTKRARAEEGAFVEWVDCNIGSKVTMKYPSVFLMGRGAQADTLSVALAGPGQMQDAGAKMVHMAPDTRSNVVSKSVSFGGGRTAYRGLSRVVRGAERARVSVRCDALILDAASRSDTYPTIKIDERSTRMEHEAKVSRLGEKELFYLRSRGLNEVEAASLIVTGFFEPLIKTLPIDYAVEMNRLIQLEMEGSVG
jgi:Fe-S cluster assembly protein SufB